MKITYLAAFATVVATAACGSNAGAPVDGATAGQAMGADAEGAPGNFDSSGGAGIAAVSCPGGGTIDASGTLTDEDADGVVDSLTATYTACKFPGNGLYVQYDGTETWTDPTPAVADTSAHLSYDMTTLLSTNAGDYSVSAAVTGAADVSSPAAGEYQLTGTGSGATTYHTPNRDKVVTHSHQWTWVYSPSAAFHLGQPVVDGSMTANGHWTFQSGAKSVDATVTTVTPLTIAPRATCATHVTAGELQGVFTDGAKTGTITVTWTGCGQRNVQFAEQ
jgi:hypothetical protein